MVLCGRIEAKERSVERVAKSTCFHKEWKVCVHMCVCAYVCVCCIWVMGKGMERASGSEIEREIDDERGKERASEGWGGVTQRMGQKENE